MGYSKKRAKKARPEMTTMDIEKAIFEATGDKVEIGGNGLYWSFSSDELHHMTFTLVCVEYLEDLTLDEWVEKYRAIKDESDTLKSAF